jgi:hypothetical protein
LLTEDDLQSANSVVALGANGANITGTVAGGIIVAGIGAGWAMVADGISFLIAGLLVFTLRKYGKTRVQTEHSPSVYDDLAHGWKEFSSRSWVVAVVAGYSIIAMIFESVFAVVGPVHAEQELGGPKPWSWILAALSAGMIAGVLVSLKVRPKHPLLDWSHSATWSCCLDRDNGRDQLDSANYDQRILRWNRLGFLHGALADRNAKQHSTRVAFQSFFLRCIWIAGFSANRFNCGRTIDRKVWIFDNADCHGSHFCSSLAAMLAVPAVRQLEGKTPETAEIQPESLNS